VALVIASSLLLWPTLLFLIESWDPNPENMLGHGWLLIAVAAWAFWLQGGELDHSVPRGFGAGAVVVGLSALWAIANSASIVGVAAIVWPLLVAAVLWMAFGWKNLQKFFYPLLLLVLATPIWELLHPILWAISTVGTRLLVGMLGVPTHFVGNVIELSSGKVEIAAGCAGIAFFAAAVSLAAIIGYMNRLSLWRLIVLAAAAAAMAIVCNVLRITIIVFEAHRTRMQTTLITDDHYTFGWILFAVFMMVFVFAFSRFGMRSDQPPNSIAAPLDRIGLRPVLALVLAAVGPLWSYAAYGQQGPEPVRLQLPPDFTPASTAEIIWNWHPKYLGAESDLLGEQDAESTRLVVYAARYLRQRQGQELIGPNNELLPADRWIKLSAETHTQYHQQSARDSNGHIWVIRHAYVVGDRVGASEKPTQIYSGLRQLVGRGGAGVVVLAARCISADDCIVATTELERAWLPSVDFFRPQLDL
jgi:exosortase